MADLRHEHARIDRECRCAGDDAFGAGKDAVVEVAIGFVGGKPQRTCGARWQLRRFNAQ